MSGYEPQQGDEVIVQLRGHVSNPRDGDGFFVRSQARSSYVRLLHVVSVEKVEPPKPLLPTTPGSVIRWRVSSASPWYCYLLQSHGRWRCQDADSWAIEPDELTGRGEIEYPFLYDAGAES